jgi:uncharacterized membrane protein (UPF0127 family)
MIEAVPMGRPQIAALATLIILAACGGQTHPQSGLPLGDLVIGAGTREVRVNVEIAATYEAKVKGLMGRRSLPPDTGMVFLREEARPGEFWMKNTLIPLSLAVWGTDGRIGAILDMEPCREDPCPLSDPGVAWVGAVEVNQGFFEDHGVEVGDRVRLER